MKKLFLPLVLFVFVCQLRAQDTLSDAGSSDIMGLVGSNPLDEASFNTGSSMEGISMGTSAALSPYSSMGAARKRLRYAFDYGFGVGMANYLGEMGGKEKPRRDGIADMKLNQTRWTVGGFARYKFNNFVAAHAGLTYVRIQGDDKLSTNRGRRGRNLSFKNDMLELALRGDVYVYGVNDVGGTGRYRLDFKAYLFGGIAGVLHSPKTAYNGEWVKLRPLMTEGVKYSKMTFAIPIGMGIYFTNKRKYRFGFEAGWRISFTDYLDDVSNLYVDHSDSENQMLIDLANRRPELGDDASVARADNYLPGMKRGDPTHNDTYFYAMFTYSYVLRGRNTFYTQNYNWLFGKRGRHRLVRVKF